MQRCQRDKTYTQPVNRIRKSQVSTPFTSNEARIYVEHNSVENISQGLVHLTKSDTASAPLISESEEREEITAETAEVPAPAPTLKRDEEQSQNCRYTYTCTCTYTGESQGTASHSRT